jgi:hypothetical protein
MIGLLHSNHRITGRWLNAHRPISPHAFVEDGSRKQIQFPTGREILPGPKTHPVRVNTQRVFPGRRLTNRAMKIPARDWPRQTKIRPRFQANQNPPAAAATGDVVSTARRATGRRLAKGRPESGKTPGAREDIPMPAEKPN